MKETGKNGSRGDLGAGTRAAYEFGYDWGLSIGIMMCITVSAILILIGIVWGLWTRTYSSIVVAFFDFFFVMLLVDCCKIADKVSLLSLGDILQSFGEDTAFNRVRGYAFAALVILLLIGTAILIALGGLTAINGRLVSWLTLKMLAVIFWNLMIRVRMAELDRFREKTHLGL